MLRHLFLSTACLLPFLVSPAMAATFTSGANATSTRITVAGTVQADALVAPVAGTAGPDYSRTGGVASVNQDFTLASGLLGTATQGLTAGIVSTAASSAGQGATASATLANVNELLSSRLLGDTLPTAALGLTADAISSTTTAGIDANGDLFGTASSSIANLALTGTALGLLTVNGSLYSNPAANTVLLSLATLKVTLNEQLRSQDATGISLQTNAVHIALNNYSLAGKLLTGDVILGHSEASASAVPEPATWATMLCGFGAVGFGLRGTRGRRAVAAG